MSPTPSVEHAETESDDGTLRSSLVGLRPRVELISQTCALDAGRDLVWEDRLCVLDADGRVRAWRRVALGGRVFAAQVDELVVFVVAFSDVSTRFARRWWRWDLRDDRLEALPFEPNGEIPRETSFGVLLVPQDGATSVRLVTHDSVEALRGWEGVGANALWRVGNETFVWTNEGLERVVVRDGELAFEPFAQFGSGVRERRVLTPGTFVAWVEDRSGTSVQLVAPPSAEVITIPTGLRRAESLRARGRTVELARGRQRVTVDVDTRTVTRHQAPERTVIHLDDWHVDRPATPVAVHDVRWSAGALLVTTADSVVRIPTARTATSPPSTAEGVAVAVRDEPEPPAADPSDCRCEGDARVCPNVRVDGACIAIDAERAPVFDPSSRFRVDYVEADFLRVTRLIDGERLWLRVTTRPPDEADVAVDLVAQTDDGAHEGASSPDDWRARDGVGSSAVLAPLPPPREGLIARFFAGESMAARP